MQALRGRRGSFKATVELMECLEGPGCRCRAHSRDAFWRMRSSVLASRHFRARYRSSALQETRLQQPSYYAWKAKFGGMSVSDAQRLMKGQLRRADLNAAALLQANILQTAQGKR